MIRAMLDQWELIAVVLGLAGGVMLLGGLVVLGQELIRRLGLVASPPGAMAFEPAPPAMDGRSVAQRLADQRVLWDRGSLVWQIVQAKENLLKLSERLALADQNNTEAMLARMDQHLVAAEEAWKNAASEVLQDIVQKAQKEVADARVLAAKTPDHRRRRIIILLILLFVAILFAVVVFVLLPPVTAPGVLP